ncbi:hypothetical protein FY528_16580 [Hymenobacter lutimineralis]|uniref:Lipoprotein n=1 Tax=Hymenobacter lutimineralis TaxID=2606448 RepID=A0A5D6UVF9_9BACT|nr:hypothetical protein [Hymenobacter lutimineralis]TYZ06888.1 hypothetical protein FY528_16580 [Hymenobacter lutimineralis]
MLQFRSLLFALAALCWLMACESAPPATATRSLATSRPLRTPVPAAGSATANFAVPKPNSEYAGVYAVSDTAICPLFITITRQGNAYLFSCTNGRTTKGNVQISREADGMYFTFVGLKGEDLEEDISASWEDGTLRIQNYGNSMNEYTRFGNCDAKYLELRRQ